MIIFSLEIAHPQVLCIASFMVIRFYLLDFPAVFYQVGRRNIFLFEIFLFILRLLKLMEIFSKIYFKLEQLYLDFCFHFNFYILNLTYLLWILIFFYQFSKKTELPTTFVTTYPHIFQLPARILIFNACTLLQLFQSNTEN